MLSLSTPVFDELLAEEEKELRFCVAARDEGGARFAEVRVNALKEAKDALLKDITNHLRKENPCPRPTT